MIMNESDLLLKAKMFIFNFRNKTLSEHITSLEKDLKTTSDDLFATREQLTYYKMDNGNLHEEMTVINQVKKKKFTKNLIHMTTHIH